MNVLIVLQSFITTNFICFSIPKEILLRGRIYGRPATDGHNLPLPEQAQCYQPDDAIQETEEKRRLQRMLRETLFLRGTEVLLRVAKPQAASVTLM